MAREGILAGLVLIPFKRFLNIQKCIFSILTPLQGRTIGMLRCKVCLTLFSEQVVILRAISFKTAKTYKT